MNPLQELQQQVDSALCHLDLPTEPAELYEPIRYTLQNGGKRMRPVLVLLGCKLFNEDVSQALNPALGIEIFHNFTLLHDDIMDNAPLRRGVETVHRKWNNHVAILSGDATFIKAYQHMVKTRPEILPQVLDDFNRTALQICEGQQLDMNFEELESVSIADYLTMIRLKTAVLLGTSLKIGATTGGADGKEAERLYDFGLNAGIAFQLQDDILDVYGESRKVGKQQGGDIISNKKTFLLLKAVEIASDEQRKRLNTLLAGNYADRDKVAAVTALYHELNVRELAEAEMWKYFNRGLESLSKVEGDANWKTVLEQFATDLMHRES